MELTEPALAWAERNLAGTGVDLRQGDIANAFDDLLGKADVVLANPPYIPLEAWESVAPEARDHDPQLALFSGDDGLDAMRVLDGAPGGCCDPGAWWAPSTPTSRGSPRRRSSRPPAAGSRSATTRPRPGARASRHCATGTMSGVTVQRPDPRTSGRRPSRRLAARYSGHWSSSHRHGLRHRRRRVRPGGRRTLLDAKGRGREMPPPVLVTARPPSTPSPPRARLRARPGRRLLARPADAGVPPAAVLQWDLGDTRGTVAVRMPDHEVALEVLERTGPLAVSSANRPGGRPPSTPTTPRRCWATRSQSSSTTARRPAGEASTIVDVTGTAGRECCARRAALERAQRRARGARADEDDGRGSGWCASTSSSSWSPHRSPTC